MKGLFQYLINLNSNELGWKIYVNPADWDEFETGLYPAEGWVSIGSLESLSFGFQSETDALNTYFLNNGDARAKLMKDHLGGDGDTIRCDIYALIDAYIEGSLPSAVIEDLRIEAELIQAEWAQAEARRFLSEVLPTLMAEVAGAA